jgi:hypothetical protein
LVVSAPRGELKQSAVGDFSTSINYQAAYLRLLSKFIRSASVALEEVLTGVPDFTLAPNPAGQFCRVRINQSLSEEINLRLLNPTGQVLRNRQMTDIETVLDLTGLPERIYFVERRSDNGSSLKKAGGGMRLVAILNCR